MPVWLTNNAWRWLIVGALISLLALAVACGDDDDDDDDTGTPAGTQTDAPDGTDEPADGEVDAMLAPFFPQSGRVILREAIEQGLIDEFLFTDGTKSQSMFDEIGVENFEGMSGTQPGAPNEEFTAAFSATGEDPDAPYAKEGYDSTFLLALAAASANSTDGTAIRDNLRFVANPPGERIGIGPDEFARAVGLLEQGEDIDYFGASGPADLDENGDLASGLVATWKIVEGVITHQQQSEVDLAAAAGVDVPAGEQVRSDTAPTEALKLGAIISQTGDLADFGPPILAGAQLAVDHMNEAGGLFGQDVTLASADDATTPEQGQAEAQRLIEVEGVHAIIGALSSAVTQTIAENVASPATIPMISPASTAAAITTANDNDFLFRTPIQDAAQAEVLADLAIELGYDSVCILYVNTPYGQGLAEGFTTNFQALGGTVPASISVEQEQTTYVSEIQQCVGG
ncbi:MAG TPA: ABC transporter substrate-binding protein [Dehalococcoidia bacterium]|nr:ABC transporter substrate-binding protein [Dehalococcoidia bacterium]